MIDYARHMNIYNANNHLSISKQLPNVKAKLDINVQYFPSKNNNLKLIKEKKL